MYYCLTSTRKIGNYSQNISSYQRHSPVNEVSGTTNPLVQLHTSFRNQIATLDGSWDKGSLKWEDIQMHDDYATDISPYTNPATTAIITIGYPTATDNFKTATFRLYNIGIESFATAITSAFRNLTGLSLSESATKNVCYITNAVLIIHPKESV